MASILTPLLRKGFVKNYLDDLIVFAPTFPDVLEHLKKLFSLLTTNCVNLNRSKCTFELKDVTFLGHRISAEGSKPDPKNVEAVVRMKVPTRAKKSA